MILYLFPVRADFAPGDIYREYLYVPSGFLRVGGELDYGGGNITFLGGAVDLEGATKAEVNIAKLLCHDQTRGLAVSVNNNAFKTFPEASAITSPQYNYQHMIYPTVSVPLNELVAGQNVFKLKVDDVGWWPQNLIYGVILRVYYNSSKPHPTGTITSPSTGATIGQNPTVSASASSDGNSVSRVDFIGHYEDFNWEGDGIYTRWHYVFFKGSIKYQMGSVSGAGPYSITWNTEWIPDQTQPMKIMARIRDGSGMYYNTAAVTGINLVRPGKKVELCKSYNIPAKWVTRKADYQCNFNVSSSSDLSEATAARMCWCSWSPAYARGIGVNGTVVIQYEGPHYDYYMHKVPFSPSLLKNGVNTAFTNKTPLIDGEMVHGMEVNWPGICIIVQYDSGPDVTPPTVKSAAAPTAERVTVTFSEPLDKATAETAGNYAINGITVSAASLSGNTVTLSTSALPEKVQKTVTVTGVKDAAGNTIAGSNTATLMYEPFDGWREDFEDGVADGFLTGEGTWTVSGGVISNSGSGRTSCWYGGQSFGDIAYSVDITPGSGTDVWSIFRAQDKSNYYLYTLKTGKLYKLENASYTELASGTAGYAAGTKYTIKTELSGSSIKVYRDGSLVLSHVDDTFSSGYVGFGSYSASGTFDNAMVPIISSIFNPERLTSPLSGITLSPSPLVPGTPLPVRGIHAEDIDRLAVFTLTGELVVSLPGSVSWNGTDSRGNALAPGLYIIELTSGSAGSRQAIMITR